MVGNNDGLKEVSISRMQNARNRYVNTAHAESREIALRAFMDAAISVFKNNYNDDDKEQKLSREAKVRIFMDATDQEINNEPVFPHPTVVSLRKSLLEEEFEEFMVATKERNLVDTVDALGDMLYVIYGTFASIGVDPGPVFDEIHRSNMTKTIGGVRFAKGKIAKGDSYSPPDIYRVLDNQRSKNT